MENKICVKCKISKNITEYYKKSKGKDGYRNSCKICLKQQTGTYAKKNRNKRNLIQKKMERR